MLVFCARLLVVVRSSARREARGAYAQEAVSRVHHASLAPSSHHGFAEPDVGRLCGYSMHPLPSFHLSSPHPLFLSFFPPFRFSKLYISPHHVTITCNSPPPGERGGGEGKVQPCYSNLHDAQHSQPSGVVGGHISHVEMKSLAGRFKTTPVSRCGVGAF
jgi:hypothetical protein